MRTKHHSCEKSLDCEDCSGAVFWWQTQLNNSSVDGAIRSVRVEYEVCSCPFFGDFYTGEEQSETT